MTHLYTVTGQQMASAVVYWPGYGMAACSWTPVTGSNSAVLHNSRPLWSSISPIISTQHSFPPRVKSEDECARVSSTEVTASGVLPLLLQYTFMSWTGTNLLLPLEEANQLVMLRYSSCLKLNTFHWRDETVHCPDTTASDWTLDSDVAVADQVEHSNCSRIARGCVDGSLPLTALLNICKSRVECCSINLLWVVFLKRTGFNIIPENI
jgi:hypothetical protein